MRIKHWLVASSLLVAGSAMAAPIGSFDYDTDTGFIGGTGTCNNGGAAACTLTESNLNGAGYYNTVSWGTGHLPSNPNGDQSNINIVNYAGSIAVNGGWETLDALTHTNHVITSLGGYMDLIGIQGLINFSNPNPNALPNPFGSAYPLGFLETYNDPDENCAGPNPLGTFCDDIFTTAELSGVALLHNDGVYNYYIQFQFVAGPGAYVVYNGDGTVTIYTSEACSADGQSGCDPDGPDDIPGNADDEPYTPGVSTVYTQARIWSVVPEPGVLALFGIGALAFGLRRRRM